MRSTACTSRFRDLIKAICVSIVGVTVVNLGFKFDTFTKGSCVSFVGLLLKNKSHRFQFCLFFFWAMKIDGHVVKGDRGADHGNCTRSPYLSHISDRNAFTA